MKKIRRQNKRKRHKRRRPINVAASFMTTLNLYWGAASIFASISGDFTKAAYFIWAALLFDIFDGYVARVTNSTSEFGKELDSLSDVVSFGMAPAVLIFTAFLQADRAEGSMAARVGSVFAIVYVICAALRLARYNVYQSARRDIFVGLPSPAAGCTVASFVLFAQYYRLDVTSWLLGPMTLFLAGLMVSAVPYPKERFRSFLLSPRHAFRMLVLCVLAIAAFHYAVSESPAIILFPACAAGVLMGVVNAFIQKSREMLRSTGDPAAKGQADESPPS